MLCVFHERCGKADLYLKSLNMKASVEYRIASCYCKLYIASCILPVVYCKLYIASCILQVVYCKLYIASCIVQVVYSEINLVLICV